MHRKRIWLFLILAIVLIRIFYIIGFGEIEKEYDKVKEVDLTGASKVECTDIVQSFMSNEKYLNKLEIYFDDIPVDATGGIVLKIQNGDELIYQAYLSLANITNQAWKEVYVNCPLKQGQIYSVSLVADQCPSVPSVYLTADDLAATEAIKSFHDEQILEGNVAINYGYLHSPALFDRILSALIWVMIYVVFAIFICRYEKIRDSLKKVFEKASSDKYKEIIVCVLELIFLWIILSGSGIVFEEYTKIIFFVLSLLSIIQYEKKAQYIRKLADTSWKRTFVCILYVCAAFTLVGNSIFVYPIDAEVKIAGIFVFCITVLWFIPVINTFLYLLNFLWKKMFEESNAERTYSFIFLVILLLCLLGPAAINLYANNPGIGSWDTWFCMIDNARDLYAMNGWQPPIYCLILKMILRVWNSTYAVIIWQYLFWSYVMLELLLYVRKKGCKDIWIIILALLFGTNASNYMLINTIWKDVPYTMSLLWCMVIVAKLVLDQEMYKHKYYIYFELVLALSGVCLYRNNGIVCLVIISISIFAVAALRKNFKIWMSIILSLVVVFLVQVPLYSHFGVDRTDERTGKYIGLGQDILGTYYAGGEVSEETMQMINVMTAYNNAEYIYDPASSNQSTKLDVEVKDFIESYIDTFFKNPVLTTRAVLARVDAAWDVYPGNESSVTLANFYGTPDGIGDWNDYYPTRKINSFTIKMNDMTTYIANTQWLNAIVWRCGLLTLLGIAALLNMIIRVRRKRYLIAYSPILGQVIGLALSTGWSNFRYFWPLNLMNMFFIIYTFMVIQKEQKA